MVDDQLVNQFPCYYDNCGQVFIDYRGFKAHENKCHNEFIFKCRDPSCEYSGAKDNRVNHWRLQHTVDSYTCEECGKEYKWLDQFRNHVKTHNADNEVTCDICKKVFPHAYALEGHKSRIHVQPENYRFQCPENNCNLKFRRKENVEAHLVHDHGRDRKYNCEWCPAKFIQKIHLSRHIKNFHKTANPRTPSVRMRSRNTKNEPAKKIIDTVESVGSAVLLPTHSSAPHQEPKLITTQITTQQTCVVTPEQFSNLQQGFTIPKITIQAGFLMEQAF